MALPLESDPQDVALASDGDILITPNGLVFISGIQAVVQAARVRMLFFLQEWFLNMDIGIPYFEELIGDASKVPGVLDRARVVFAAAILDTPGIVEILQLQVTKNNQTRGMQVLWSARSQFGDTPTDLLQTPGAPGNS